MICLNCGNKLKDDELKCPACGFKIKKKSVELELPILKKEEDIVEIDDTDSNLSDNDFEIELKDAVEDDNFDKFEGIDEIPEDEKSEESDDDILFNELSLEKTRSISPIDDKEEIAEFSLVDDISKQIDDINNEVRSDSEIINLSSKKEEVDKVSDDYSDEEISTDNNDFATVESIKKRKNILMITGIVLLLLAIVIVLVMIFGNKTKKEESTNEYLENMTKALQTYYDKGEIDDVIYVLEEVKTDADKVKNVQAKTRTICDSWMLLYFDEKAANKAEFEEISERYKGLVNGLHTYALVKNNNVRIKALTDTDYDELIRQVNDIYSDSVSYFDALSLYNEKDYNRAYYSFDRIENSNHYYEKAISYKNKIIDNILDILKNDINKIENGVELLEDKDKLLRYTEIESIIFEYNNVYASVELSNSEEYQKLLSTYTSKVSEYNDKVSNSVVTNDNLKNDSNINEEDNNTNEEVNVN